MANAVTRQPGPDMIADGLVLSDKNTVVRAMTAADTSFDRQLFDEDRGTQFSPLGLNGPLLTLLLDQQFRAQQLGYQTDFPDAEHLIIAHAGQPVGRLTTSLGMHGDRRTLHVVYIVLSASTRGRGIGTDVMTSLDHAAQAQGATRLSLSVLQSNVGARRLYDRLGFVATGDDGVRTTMIRQLA